MELYTVIVDGEERQYEAGTTYQQIAEEFQDRYENDIVLVLRMESSGSCEKK